MQWVMTFYINSGIWNISKQAYIPIEKIIRTSKQSTSTSRQCNTSGNRHQPATYGDLCLKRSVPQLSNTLQSLGRLQNWAEVSGTEWKIYNVPISLQANLFMGCQCTFAIGLSSCATQLGHLRNTPKTLDIELSQLLEYSKLFRHTDDGIHSDHGYLDTLDNPLGPP